MIGGGRPSPFEQRWLVAIVPELTDIPILMNHACDSLEELSFSYSVGDHDFDELPDENKANSMATIALQRGIDLKLEIVLKPYTPSYYEGFFDDEDEDIVDRVS